MKKIDISKKISQKTRSQWLPPTVASRQPESLCVRWGLVIGRFISHRMTNRLTSWRTLWRCEKLRPINRSVMMDLPKVRFSSGSRSEPTKKPLGNQNPGGKWGIFGEKGESNLRNSQSLDTIMWWQNWNDRKFNYYPSNHPTSWHLYEYSDILVQTLHYTHVVGPSALFGSNSFFPEDALADAYAMIYHGSYILEESYKLSNKEIIEKDLSLLIIQNHKHIKSHLPPNN